MVNRDLTLSRRFEAEVIRREWPSARRQPDQVDRVVLRTKAMYESVAAINSTAAADAISEFEELLLVRASRANLKDWTRVREQFARLLASEGKQSRR